MKRVIHLNCYRAVQPLLCVFVFGFFSCSSLRNVDDKSLKTKQSLLQLAIKESDFTVFNQQVQELGLVAVDVRPAISNVYGGDQNEFWLTFRFAIEAALMRCYVMVMSYGFARRISYRY